MLQHLIKWTVVAALWRKFSPFFAGTLFGIAALLLVSFAHSEFLHYKSMTDSTEGVLASFIAKWSAFGIIGAIYALYLYRKTGRFLSSKVKTQGTSRSNSSSKRAHPMVDQSTPSASEPTVEQTAEQIAEDAAFDFLRHSKPLRGRGELMLDSKDERR